MNENRGIWRGKTTPKADGEAFNNMWVEGNLIRSETRYYIHPVSNSVKVRNELGRLIVMHEVDPSTLGECTGIPAMNDMTIFEGDIVKTKYGSDIIVGFVEYDKYIGAFVLNDGVYSYMFGSDITNDECEIIGNIHDNSERLREGATDDASPVKHGYWDDSFDGITPVCSVCGMTHHEYVRCPDYCPHCNAKMDGKGAAE